MRIGRSFTHNKQQTGIELGLLVDISRNARHMDAIQALPAYLSSPATFVAVETHIRTQNHWDQLQDLITLA